MKLLFVVESTKIHEDLVVNVLVFVVYLWFIILMLIDFCFSVIFFSYYILYGLCLCEMNNKNIRISIKWRKLPAKLITKIGQYTVCVYAFGFNKMPIKTNQNKKLKRNFADELHKIACIQNTFDKSAEHLLC